MMGENSNIEWTHHTFNPWWGCTRISPGCDHCYADTWARRTGHADLWDTPKRRTFGAKHWSDPLAWNRQAERDGVRRRVFCASMADVFDKDGPQAERENLWDLIEDTPHLDWLLLTKRVGNVLSMIPFAWTDPLPRNVWLGISVVNQAEADRDVPKLLRIPAVVRFLSCEPLIGPIELFDFNATGGALRGPAVIRSGGRSFVPGEPDDWVDDSYPGIHWCIVGGESGHHARAMNPAWVKSLRTQCVGAGVAFLFKQWGQFLPAEDPKARNYAVPDDSCVHEWDDSELGYSIRVRSKHAAGRLLEGREWNEFPRSPMTQTRDLP